MSKPKAPLNKLNYIRFGSSSYQNGDLVSDEQFEIPQNNQAGDNVNESKNEEVSSPNLQAQSVDSQVSYNNSTIDDGTSNQSQENKLPRFLSRLQNSFSQENASFTDRSQLNWNQNDQEERSLTIVDNTKKEKRLNPNSFSSIFNRDHQEIRGIQRVFKKSIAFLVINLSLFGILTLVSINLFSTPIWFTLAVWILFGAVSNIFYIIVADRSYVWLGITGNIILLLLVHSFLGQGFDPVTLVSGLIVTLLIYSAYAELEKIQLGSRLFFISHITGETTRILSTGIVILLSLGLFSSMVSQGASDYLDENVLGNEVIVSNLFIGENRDFSINRLFLKGYKFYGEGNTENTLRDFLIDNYQGGRAVITQTEQTEIIIACEARLSAGSDCFSEVSSERDKRLLEWKSIAYPRTNADLDTVVNEDLFNSLIREHYIYLINDLSSTQTDLLILPSRYTVPAFFSILLFGFLIIFRIIINWVVLIVTWIIWRILRMTGFAKIEVEPVEAEIVSI